VPNCQPKCVLWQRKLDWWNCRLVQGLALAVDKLCQMGVRKPRKSGIFRPKVDVGITGPLVNACKLITLVCPSAATWWTQLQCADFAVFLWPLYSQYHHLFVFSRKVWLCYSYCFICFALCPSTSFVLLVFTRHLCVKYSLCYLLSFVWSSCIPVCYQFMSNCKSFLSIASYCLAFYLCIYLAGMCLWVLLYGRHLNGFYYTRWSIKKWQ